MTMFTSDTPSVMRISNNRGGISPASVLLMPHSNLTHTGNHGRTWKKTPFIDWDL